ncbi:hypothetical protein GOBAR_AA28760 [Gossypium barbadense]|uniref:Uncharacterized protein n=1 Tax=Gossypium barbadense TaxID=3634 RepID=A0A2P5WLJ0_GOSBA|nr:hypothetical protein GOBAR_AA28760 [Gossypium barbadense]
MGTRRPLILQMVHYRSALEPRCRFQVLTETDHCYCVLVNALDGEAFPSEKDTNDSSSSNKVPLRVDTNSMKTKNKFSLLKEVLTNNCLVFDVNINDGSVGSSGFGSLLSMGHSSGKKDRLCMKGPGGCGEVEVAVSGVALSFLSLAAACSTASVTSLLVNVSSTYCPSKICSRYQLSAAMTFMLRLLSFVLILFNLWLLLSL